MIKIYLKYNNVFGYQVFEKAQTKNYELQNLYLFLAGWSQTMLDLNKLAYANNLEWIEVEKHEDSGEIIIWSRFSLKENIKFHNFLSTEEASNCLSDYHLYIDKRWKEMKKITITFLNYNQILESWEKIGKAKPQYIILSLDNVGPLDTVDLVGKNELSQEDLQEMQQEHDQYLRWSKAVQLYNDDHEIVDDLWHSPADSVYDADIAKYLDRTEGFAKHKNYKKADIVVELQEKLKKEDPVYLIVHWLRIRMVYGVIDSDPLFKDLLRYFACLDNNYSDMISREKLQEIADRLSLGQDVVLG